jgi:hypothetical protein
VAGVNLRYLSGLQSHNRIDIISHTPRFRDIGKGPSREDGVSRKEYFRIELIDADGTGSMPRRMDYLKDVTFKVKERTLFKPEMHRRGNLI